MKSKLAAVTIVGAFLATAVLGVWIGTSGGETTQASPAVGLGTDADPAGNTATSLGAIQSCRQVNVGDTFDIDIWVTDVSELFGFEMDLTYDSAILEVTGRTSKTFFLDSAPGSSVTEDSVIYQPGFLWMFAQDTATNAAESGSGVISRVSLHAIAPGIGPITLEKSASRRVPRLVDSSGNSMGPTVGDRDKDGDGLYGEDPVDATDNDGDGLTDEDPPDGAFNGPIFNGQIAVGQACPRSNAHPNHGASGHPNPYSHSHPHPDPHSAATAWHRQPHQRLE